MGLLDNFSFEKAKTNLLGTTPEEQSKSLSSISAALRRSTGPDESTFGNVSQAIFGGRSEREVANKNSSLAVKKEARGRANDFLALMPNGKSLNDLSPEDQLKVKTYIESEDGDYSSLLNLSWGVGEKKGKVLPAMLGKFTTESLDTFGKSGVFADLSEIAADTEKVTTKREGQYKRPGDASSVFGYVREGIRYMRVDGEETVMPDGYKKIDKPLQTINKLNKFEQTDFITKKVEGMPSYTERERQVALADQTIEVLQSDISKGVPVSERGVSELYNAVGGSKAAVEISRLISGGSLKQRFKDWASKGFSGALSNATSEEYVQLALIARKYAANQINKGLDRIGANFAGSADLIDTDGILNTYRIKNAEIPMGSVRNAGDASFRYIGGPVGDASSWEGM